MGENYRKHIYTLMLYTRVVVRDQGLAWIYIIPSPMKEWYLGCQWAPNKLGPNQLPLSISYWVRPGLKNWPINSHLTHGLGNWPSTEWILSLPCWAVPRAGSPGPPSQRAQALFFRAWPVLGLGRPPRFTPQGVSCMCLHVWVLIPSHVRVPEGPIPLICMK